MDALNQEKRGKQISAAARKVMKRLMKESQQN
jgi:hypothetical protein